MTTLAIDLVGAAAIALVIALIDEICLHTIDPDMPAREVAVLSASASWWRRSACSWSARPSGQAGMRLFFDVLVPVGKGRL